MDTRNDVTVAKGSWVNLYAASTIAVGTAVTVINKGISPAYVVVAATAPSITPTPKGFPLFVGEHSTPLVIASGASGLWAFSQNFNATLLVQD
jgi:hypothetical protein